MQHGQKKKKSKNQKTYWVREKLKFFKETQKTYWVREKLKFFKKKQKNHTDEDKE